MNYKMKNKTRKLQSIIPVESQLAHIFYKRNAQLNQWLLFKTVFMKLLKVRLAVNVKN